MRANFQQYGIYVFLRTHLR